MRTARGHLAPCARAPLVASRALGELYAQDWGTVSFGGKPGGAGGGPKKPQGSSSQVTSSGFTAAALDNETDELKRTPPRATTCQRMHAMRPRGIGVSRARGALPAVVVGVTAARRATRCADEKVSKDLKLAIMQARAAKGLTQKQLAQQLNMQPTIINEYESGKAIPNNAIISKIERVLGAKLPRSGGKKK